MELLYSNCRQNVGGLKRDRHKHVASVSGGVLRRTTHLLKTAGGLSAFSVQRDRCPT